LQGYPSNLDKAGLAPKTEVRKGSQHRRPGGVISFGIGTDVGDPRIERRPETLPQERKQLVAKPRTIVPGIGIGWIIEQRWAGGRVGEPLHQPFLQFGSAKRQEWSHKSVGPQRRDPGKSDDTGTSQKSEHHRLNLVVLMVTGDQI
jgi:hypothetical protein